MFFYLALKRSWRKYLLTKIMLLTISLATASWAAFNIVDYGANGDNQTLNTQAIQAAIDACASSGGGTVYVPAGKFLTGTLFLKNNVTLFLEAGAVLLGSPQLKDYPVTVPALRSYTDNYTNKSLIYAEKQHNIAILGGGMIDGQGTAFSGPYKNRPFILRVIECKNITVRDVSIVNAPMWVQHYLACENVNIDGITVHSHVNKNNDGIDIDCCQKVRIANCNINSGDDAIVLKSTSAPLCREITITNCVLRSRCNAFKLGTESNGGFQNITLSNCTIYDTRLAGIALETVDGGILDRVNVSNVTMKNVGGCIFIRLGHRARKYHQEMEKPPVGVVRNISISQVQAVGIDSIGCAITGLPYHPVENVNLNNIRITFRGGGSAELASRKVEELPDKYPEYNMFGGLPAYGFYCRHVKNLKFSQVELDFAHPEQRPAFSAEDVHDLTLFDFDAQLTESTPAMIWLRQVKGAFIHGCRPKNKINALIHIEDALTTNVVIMNNDFSQVKQVVTPGKNANLENTFIENNR